MAVFYPPLSVSEEQLQAKTLRVRKGATVELDCALEHKGFPEAEAAVWLADGIRMKNQSGLRITVENAGVETDRKYTCIPFNKVRATLNWIICRLINISTNLFQTIKFIP